MTRLRFLKLYILLAAILFTLSLRAEPYPAAEKLFKMKTNLFSLMEVHISVLSRGGSFLSRVNLPYEEFRVKS